MFAIGENMRRTLFIAVLICGALLSACASCCTQAARPSADSVPGADATDFEDAVAIAQAALVEQSRYPADDYTLVSARQLPIKGQYIWRVTFKPTELLPKDPSKEAIGAGGEIFVNVDLDTRKPEIKYGE
jgi:hypothetical protein